MAYIVGFVSQKGGVGKSTLARMLACEAARGGLNVKIADTDIQQGTSFEWMKRRAQFGIEPGIRVETFDQVKKAIRESENFDLYIFDGAPHASRDTREIATASDLIVIPTSQGLDDLNPSILLGHDLVEAGIAAERICFALVKVTDSEREVDDARGYIEQAGYRVLAGHLPVKTAFSKAHDQGRAVSEVPFRSLRKKVDQLAQSLIDAVSGNEGREAA